MIDPAAYRLNPDLPPVRAPPGSYVVELENAAFRGPIPRAGAVFGETGRITHARGGFGVAALSTTGGATGRLLRKNREGSLKVDEQSEWELYGWVEHLRRLAKARAHARFGAALRWARHSELASGRKYFKIFFKNRPCRASYPERSGITGHDRTDRHN